MSNLADQMGFEVTYHGVNGVGQHLFANGEPVVTDVFATLEEAVKRFGKRIDTRSREHFYAMMFMEGHARGLNGKPYAPKLRDAQSIKEYGLGFMKGLLDREVALKAPVPPPVFTHPPVVAAEPVKEIAKAPKVAVEKVTEVAVEKKPIKRRKKRRKKRKTAVLDID